MGCSLLQPILTAAQTRGLLAPLHTVAHVLHFFTSHYIVAQDEGDEAKKATTPCARTSSPHLRVVILPILLCFACECIGSAEDMRKSRETARRNVPWERFCFPSPKRRVNELIPGCAALCCLAGLIHFACSAFHSKSRDPSAYR